MALAARSLLTRTILGWLNRVTNHIVPDVADQYDLGSAEFPFRNLYVSGDFVLGDDITITGSLQVGALTTLGGNVTLSLGAGLTLVEGANARAGLATLVAGTVTVATTQVATGDRIIVSRQTVGGTPGHLSTPTASIVNGTSFVINSSEAADTSTVFWTIVRPA